MAYNPALAQRLREALAGKPGITEKKMFGGVAFMLYGNLACGLSGDDLMVRVNPQEHASALALPHVRPFDLTGKPMSGWVLVGPEGTASGADLSFWVDKGVAYAAALPLK